MLTTTIFGQQWFYVGVFSLIRSMIAINDGGDQFAESYNCCLLNRVPERCAKNLCRPPDDWNAYLDDAAYYLPVSCNSHLEQIGRCLSNGRNNSACCSRGKEVYTSCLHLCSGDAFKANLSQSKDLEYEYSSCLIEHSRKTVMRCAADGYRYIPTAPVNLRAVDIGSDYAHVEWDPPVHLAHLVTSYVVHYKTVIESRNNEAPWQRAASTPETRYRLKNLTPDTSYAFHVVAETATPGNKSGHCPATTFTTKGNLPAVTVYDAEVRVALNSTSTTLLICRVEVQGQRERALRVDWYFGAGYDDRNPERNFRVVDPKRVEAEFFPLQDSKPSASGKTYAATLRIRDVVSADYGTYKCEVTNEYGTARGVLTLKPLADNNSVADVPSSPPNLTDCCARNGVSKECLFVCQNDVDQRLTAVNIRHKKCHAQIPLLLERCLSPREAKNLAVGACCLSRRLPWHCLPLCEQQGAPFFSHQNRHHSKLFVAQCLKFSTTIFQCQLEYKSRLPYPPTDLAVTYFPELKIDKSSSSSSATVTIKWRKSRSADRYYVYYRRIRPSSGPDTDRWARIDDVRDSQTNLHNLTPSSTYTLIVLAANPFGHSYSSRPIEFSIT